MLVVLLASLSTGAHAVDALDSTAGGEGRSSGVVAQVQQLERLEPVDVDEVSHQLDRILGEPAFADARPENWFERLRRRLGDAIGRQLQRLLSAGLTGGLWSAVAVGAVLLLVVLTTFRLGRRRVAARRNHRVGALFAETGADPTDMLERASQAAVAGRYGEAVRYHFLAGLLLLSELGLLELTPDLTTAGASDQLQDAGFDSVAGRFEAIFYGNREGTADDVDHAIEGWDRLLDRQPIGRSQR